MRKILLIAIILLGAGLVIADKSIDAGRSLVQSKVGCDKLTDVQLEDIGDYYMEQMHPGQAHKTMDEMMGGDGSQSPKLMHIAMAKRLYCNDSSGAANYGMMSMMNGGMKMTAGGMIEKNMMDGGMMGGSGYGYWNFLSFLNLVLLVGLIILVYLGIFKLWKSINSKK